MKLKKVMIVIVGLVFLSSCTEKNLEVDISKSEKFSEEEITAAITQVETSVDEFLKGSQLIEVTYDEGESNRLIEDYVPTLDLAEKYQTNTLLMLNSEIKTGKESGSLDPNSTYRDYYWLLVKEQAGWKVIQAGFLV